MFEYIIKIFGISSDQKIVAQLLTGITLTIFSVLLIRILLLKQIEDDLDLFIIKFMCLILCFSNLFSYLLIKFKSEEILKLNSKIRCHRNRSSIKTINVYYPSLIAFAVWLILTTTNILLRLSDRRIEEAFHEFFSQINLSILVKSLDLFVAIVCSNTWKILIQLMYHELNIQYSSIIEAFIDEIRRKANYPDINVVRMTHRTVLEFMEIQTSLKKCEKFIKFFMNIDLMSTALLFSVFTINSISYSDSYCYCLSSVYIIVLISYSLWIRFEASFSRNCEKMLKFHLDRWQHFQTNENCFIELKVLERTVQQFIDY
jgi:hypothetical protein